MANIPSLGNSHCLSVDSFSLLEFYLKIPEVADRQGFLVQLALGKVLLHLIFQRSKANLVELSLLSLPYLKLLSSSLRHVVGKVEFHKFISQAIFSLTKLKLLLKVDL